MALNARERFENRMDVSSPETIGDAKRLTDVVDESDPYNDMFDNMMKESEGISEKKTNADTKENGEIHADDKRKIKNHPSIHSSSYKMNTLGTIEQLEKQFDQAGKEYLSKAMEAGGGKEGQRAHLRGVGEEYFLTSGEDKRASGNFLTKEHPGKTLQERIENLQLPPTNDASRVEKVISEKPAIVLTSKISPQNEWAKEVGYEAKEGIEQTFTPTLNKEGAIAAGKYKVLGEDND